MRNDLGELPFSVSLTDIYNVEKKIEHPIKA